MGEDRAARDELGVIALDHFAGQVDPRHERIDPGHAAVRDRCEPVLVVDARPIDPDRHLAGRQVGCPEAPDAPLDPIVDSLGDECPELGWDVGHDSILRPAVRPIRLVPNPLAAGVGLTIRDTSPTIPAVKRTNRSMQMCMPWRPRRVEDGA